MLPFADLLSGDERKKWVSEWRHLVWHTPRYVAVYAAVIVGVAGFFVHFMPAWQIAGTVWSAILFGAGQSLVAYILAEFAAYGFSKPVIEKRIASLLKEAPNQQPVQTSPFGRRGSS